MVSGTDRGFKSIRGGLGGKCYILGNDRVRNFKGKSLYRHIHLGPWFQPLKGLTEEKLVFLKISQ